ncbi:MAG: FtsQ-type POTRA domain-containing protein [Acidobacteria bacterium]|nr:FtsQ-type POTRA domain-containing protein [Acidobacteriota bacterium]
MRISTKKSRRIQEERSSPSNGRKIPVRKKTSQKIGKNRITGRRVLSAVRMTGKLGGILLIAAMILFVCIYVYNSEKFHLDDVAIYGCKETEPARLEQIVRENVPGNILRIDLGLLQKQLVQEKWIRHVEIRRVLPSGIILYVKERVPSVILEMSGQLMIADDDGILLDAYAPRYGKLDVPVFKGIVGKNTDSYGQYQEENTARIHHALNMLSEIESGSPDYAKMISEVDISDRSNLKIMLVDNTAEIYLGKEDYLNRFRELIDSDEYQKFKSRNISIPVVDLRFDNQIIFRGIRNVSGSPSN